MRKKTSVPTGLSTVRFNLEVLARSSIVHRDDAASFGGDSAILFRKETVVTSMGELDTVPIVSGSSLRGVLRRISEAITAEILDYEARLPVPVAHLLTNGGSLAKAAAPMSNEQERALRSLFPHLSLFGGAASGKVMAGKLFVGKLLPEVLELEHLLGDRTAGRPLVMAEDLLAEEQFTHLSDARFTSTEAPVATSGDDSPQQRISVEVIPAGARLHAEITLLHATPLEASYFLAVLSEFATHSFVGGRRAAGHGQVSATIHTTTVRGQAPDPDLDWAAALAERRDEALAALTALT